MPDWSKGMKQTFEFFEVDIRSFAEIRKIDTITSCTINRDLSSETLGSATFECTEELNECYIRVYLVVEQHRYSKSRYPLGTFLVQTPGYSFDGKNKSISIDAYTPLIELKEKYLPIGYTVEKGSNILKAARRIISSYARTKVVYAEGTKVTEGPYTSSLDSNCLGFVRELLQLDKYDLSLEADGTIVFAPYIEADSMGHVWEYSDDNSSILQADMTVKRDLYGIPNVVEVVYSKNVGYKSYIVKNENKDNPLSIQNRGREIMYRDTNPPFASVPSDFEIKNYAEKLLKQLSTAEYTVTYTHGYCPVRIGDCVRLNYKRAGLEHINAKVISQSIDCSAGCQVTETAVYTKEIYGTK